MIYNHAAVMEKLRGKAWKFHLGIVLLGWFADQLTKFWAVKKFTLPSGDIDYLHVQQIIGELIQFRLVYNSGAAFGMQPQKIIPFLHPTLFYTLISALALTVLVIFYLKIPPKENWTHIGVALITAGAFGNLTDRLRLDRVVDFIDVEFPNIAIEPFRILGIHFKGIYMDRWPTFNVADSMVCIGVGVIFAVSFVQKRGSVPKGEKGVG